MTQWLNMAKLAGFDPDRDEQFAAVMGEGTKVKWSEEIYRVENKSGSLEYKKPKMANMHGILDYQREWCEDQWKDAQMGARLFAIYDDNPCGIKDCYPTPVHRVPKMNPDRTISEKGRFVQDLRRNNICAEKDDYKKPHLPTFENMAYDVILKQFQLEKENKEMKFVKIDIDSAFKWIPVHPMDTGATATAAVVATKNGLDTLLTFSTGLVFGMGGAPGLFSYMSETIVAILRGAFRITAQMFVDDLVIAAGEDPEDFWTIDEDNTDRMYNVQDPLTEEKLNRTKVAREACIKTKKAFDRFKNIIAQETTTQKEVDDLRNAIKEFAEDMPLWTITEASYMTGWLIRFLMGTKAISKKKMVLEGKPEPKKTLWGIEFDSDCSMATLPATRLEQYRDAQNRCSGDVGYWANTYKEVQIQRGQLQWLSTVMVYLRPLLVACNQPLKYPGNMARNQWEDKGPLYPTKHDGLTTEEWDNIWTDYQEVSHITRLMYNTRPDQALMRIKWMDMLSWTTRWKLQNMGIIKPKVIVVATDASMEMMGGFNYSTKEKFQIRNDEVVQKLQDKENPHKDLAAKEDFINQFELYAVGIAISLFSKDLDPETWLAVATDNMTVYHWIRNMKAKGKKETKFIRNLVMMTTNRRVRVNVSWIRTDANKEADDLSRKKSSSGDLIPEMKIHEAIQDIKEESAVNQIVKSLDPTCKIDIQSQVALDMFRNGNQVQNVQEWNKMKTTGTWYKLLEVTNDMQSFTSWKTERDGEYKTCKWNHTPEDSTKAHIYIIHVPWIGKGRPKAIQDHCDAWIKCISEREETTDVIIFDEFAQVGWARGALENNGFTTKRWITNGVVDGSKLSTKICTTWAYRGNLAHDVVKFNIGYDAHTDQGYREQYRTVEGKQLYWNVIPQKPKTADLENSNRPLVLGSAFAPRLKGEMKKRYQVHDARGPIPLNMQGNYERDGMCETILVRSIVYVTGRDGEGTLVTPSDQYLQKWLPNAPVYKVTQGGLVKMMVRPWITSHSVRNIIMTLILKQQQGWKHVEKMKKLKISTTDQTEMQAIKEGEKGKMVSLNMITEDESQNINISIKEELKLQEVVDQVKEFGVQEIEVYLDKSLCSSDEYTERRDWFTGAIMNLASGFREVHIKIHDEDSRKVMEDAMERVRYMWETNVYGKGQ